jgi:uncharacterized phiE125 gp8 family phage protein
MLNPDYKISIQPASEPISTADAKAHLRVTHSDDNDYIDSLVKAARMHAEQFTDRAIITQTWEAYLQKFPGSGNQNEIMINKCPVTSISKIEYYDSDNTLQTLSTDVYEAVTELEPAIIRLAANQSWPEIYDRKKAIIITFVTGYANAAAVPMPIIQAMKFIIGHHYENRQDVITAMAVNEVPLASQYLLNNFRIIRFDS